MITRRPSRISSVGPRAFTLIELLVVITIISILAILVVPTLGKARRNALRTSCASNLKQVGTAVKMYLLDHNNIFPPVTPTDAPNLGLVASYYIPYLNNNVDVFRCPAQKNNLVSISAYGTRLSIPGYSNAMAFVTYEFNYFFSYPSNSYVRTATARDISDASICAYTYDFPYSNISDTDAPYLPHIGGINILYTDWHVAWLPDTEYGLSLPYAQQFFGKGHL